MLENNEQACVRGQKVAMVWKHLKKVVSTWDQLCVVWAKNHKLPAWIGHVPVIFTVLISLAGLIAGGIAIASMIVLTWAIAFIVEHMGSTTGYNDSKESGPGYRNGQDGYGYYSGSDDITSERLD